MLMPILTLLSALSISGVAIFYSVIGLATIFPGAFWPVVIMGSVLEVGKLVTASWVYRNWKFTPWLLRSYLVIAVIILSFITSMGIFGFLSKAHLEQNLAEDTVTQRIEIINSKIQQEEIYIERQKNVIARAENDLNRTASSNTEALDIEIQSLKDAEERFQTLLAVETNTIKDLNDRMKVLDADVTAVLTQKNKAFFNEELEAAKLKESQKAERDQIDAKLAEAQARIDILKQDYIKDTAKIQSRIDNLRQGGVDDKPGVTAQITKAEDNIFSAQNRIDGYILEREPLQSKILKLEAEVGPVKYIAALATDWGLADEVNTSAAVRWVILIIIVVFDPLAVLLLIAANQSLVKRFPPKAPKPQEIVDLEKPDEEDVTLKWNEMMQKANAQAKSEQADAQLKDWKSKLDAFNAKVDKPDTKHVEIIQDDDSVPHVSLKGDKRIEPTLDKELQQMRFERYDREHEKKLKEVAEQAKREEEEEQDAEPKQDIQDGFDPAEVEGYEEFNKKYDETPTISEQIERAMETERTKPDFTEVIEPETAVQEKKTAGGGFLGQVITDKKGKPVKTDETKLPNPAEMTDFERTGLLNKLHAEHGKYEDISDEELKMERDDSNRAQFLADVSLTKEEADSHPAITESRMAYFQDMIDDILRGNTTYENVPEELTKTLAQIMDPDLPNPPIITKGSALKEQRPEGIEEMSAEGLKEKFMAQPKTEERPMTDAELDNLLAGWEEEQKPTGKTKMIIKDGQKVFVPVEEEYVQNEEQDENTIWNKTKELDIPEPEKNEIILPELKSTEEDQVVDVADSIQIDNVISQEKFDTYKKRITTDNDYHSRIEQRINDLITKLEKDEIKLKDLTDEDQKVIIDILNQNG